MPTSKPRGSLWAVGDVWVVCQAIIDSGITRSSGKRESRVLVAVEMPDELMVVWRIKVEIILVEIVILPGQRSVMFNGEVVFLKVVQVK